eukprot:2240362-Pyramimonas_sp.AAC.1
MSAWKAGVERISRSPPEISLPRASQSKLSSRGALNRSAKQVAWASRAFFLATSSPFSPFATLPQAGGEGIHAARSWSGSKPSSMSRESLRPTGVMPRN